MNFSHPAPLLSADGWTDASSVKVIDVASRGMERANEQPADRLTKWEGFYADPLDRVGYKQKERGLLAE